MRKPDNADVGLGEDCEEDLADVRRNADLYVVNQEGTDLISKVHMGEAPVPHHSRFKSDVSTGCSSNSHRNTPYSKLQRRPIFRLIVLHFTAK